jgi:hypothetical protein
MSRRRWSGKVRRSGGVTRDDPVSFCQLSESTTFFAGFLSGASDVSMMFGQQSFDIVLLKSFDHQLLRLAEAAVETSLFRSDGRSGETDVCRHNLSTTATYGCAFHCVEQLADVSRPTVTLQLAKCGGRKDFALLARLNCLAVQLVRPQGTTIYGGTYQRDHQTVNVTLKPGVGDVVAEIGGRTLIAECKGGVVNTRSRRAAF